MECIVPGNNMKVLGKALQALAKIGDELYVEAKKDRLCLITLNSSKTVCARFHFFDSFFSSYDVNQNDLSAANNETITCKLHMKVFLPLFKGNLEKKLDYFKLEYETDSDFIVFKMKYKCDDIVMVHKLRLMDNETLSIGVATDSGSNNMGASSSFYNEILTMFNVSDDEITFEITTEKITARNYCTDFNFEAGGTPLSMLMRNPTFEVNFIVATLNPYSDANSSVANSNSVASKVQAPTRPVNEIADDDLEAMQAVNWEDESSKGSSFTELMKKAKSDKENLDIVPKSPESPRSKRAKTVFGRCYDPTFHETILGEVLAENSDTD
ncbi:cell cycle checkpoint control protein RAD9A [Asbolus verrucosus]|uniref:Cell cycle checkpoint control protein RAD9A n=1 Tax=Asbolus verrucosus TaxID=1661398 RepID=A0A482VDX9_ASBVE|nr:cell cycle checkpoint control protein RAD9A [Asbolus verrucosus]